MISEPWLPRYYLNAIAYPYKEYYSSPQRHDLCDVMKLSRKCYLPVAAADEAEETGWKFVHADVFRFPEHPNFFAAVIGSGTQMTFMAFAIFGLALVRL